MKLETKTAVMVFVVLLVGVCSHVWRSTAAMGAELASFTPEPTESPVKVVMAPSPTEAQDSASSALTPTAASPTAPGPTATPTPTSTPVPPTLTPWVVTPQPQAEDVFAAATLAVEATTHAATYGTPTPSPPNLVTATYTPQPRVVYNTPTPGNDATATFVALRETAIAVSTGTATPLPENAVTVTPRPTPSPTPWPTYTPHPTPTPVMVPLNGDDIEDYMWATRTPIPTPTAIPQVLVGKILLRSDYGGGQVVVVEADGSNPALLVNSWAYQEALRRERLSPDGKYTVCQRGTTHGLDLYLCPLNGNGQAPARLTYVGSGVAYDPAWSPDGTRIVFASNQQGQDELFVVERVFGNPRTVQLTRNEWEWDKHPSYSPDGKYIVYYSNRTGSNQLWVMNDDGTNRRPLWIPELAGYECWDPVWVK